MGHVVGIGGLFFRANDPEALAEWYAQNLGIPRVPRDYDAEVWQQEAGPTVFAPFKRDTEYFGRMRQAFMLNLRVRDLDGLVTKLRGVGIEVTLDLAHYPNGRFARIHDPEGNPVELWEPIEGTDR